MESITNILQLKIDHVFKFQGRFGNVEPAQTACRPATVLDFLGQAQRRPQRGPLVQREISLPEGQILRHLIRHGRQAHTMREAGGCPQVLVHVEGERQRRL